MARNVFGETTPCKVANATPVRWARVVLEVLAEAWGAGGAGGAACGFGRPSVFCCLRGGFGGSNCGRRLPLPVSLARWRREGLRKSAAGLLWLVAPRGGL